MFFTLLNLFITIFIQSSYVFVTDNIRIPLLKILSWFSFNKITIIAHHLDQKAFIDRFRTSPNSFVMNNKFYYVRKEKDGRGFENYKIIKKKTIFSAYFFLFLFLKIHQNNLMNFTLPTDNTNSYSFRFLC